MSRISVEWIDEHRREIVSGSAIIIIFFLAVFWWYIFSTASTGPLQMSAISGVVFIDDDLDGLFSPDDEFGFPAVAIQLYDSSGLLTSEVTDDEGTFIFSGLDPGQYVVREILPNDWEATTERELDVTVAQGETLFLSFGLAEIESGPIPVVLTYGTLSGTVYDDDNNNGEFDEVEVGVENVQIKLSNALGDVAELQTDSEGEYLFEDIRTGEYWLTEVVPQGWYNTTDSVVKVVVVSEQVTMTEYGIDKVTEGDGDDEEPGPSSTITVQVFRDNNENEVFDSSERGILGVAISLMEGEELVDKQSTNSKGRVFFEVTTAGTYTVMEEDLPSYRSTTPNELDVEVVLETDYEVFFGDFRRGGPPPPPPPSTSTIVGTVFNDADGDGEVDPGEDVIPGVTVTLTGGSQDDSDESNSNGQVSFSDLSDGSYQLIETDPDGYYSTTPNTLSFTVTSGTHTGIFGDAEYASLYGYAFDDADGDGIFDEGENGLYGVTVSLYDDEGLVAEDTTDEDGLYSFIELMPGIYEVSSDPVEGYFRTTPGSVQVELASGDEKRVDFGYAPDDSEFGSVFGTVYNDKDGSMDRSLGELGLEGVEITLTLVDDGSESTTTDEFGVYTFKITEEGDYNIHEDDPDGWFSTTSNDLSVDDADFSSSNGSPRDFGDTLGATVSGMVYNDLDRDGEKAGDDGVEGVLVELFLVEDLIDDTLTDVDGLYSFQILKSGDYHVEETDLIGWMSKTANTLPFTVGELTGQSIVDKDFGDYELAKGRISGTVFNDVDGSSDQGTGEAGIPDVVITLYDEDGEEVDQVQTDENGNYEFNDLIPGGYEVVETDPVGYRSITSNEVAVLVEEGDDDVVDFGDKEDGDWSSIYGTVWDDLNGNSKREVEFGIPGVTVSLYEDVPEGDDILLDTKITDLFGRYSFSVDEAGKYRVVETDPETYISTTDNDVPVTVTLGDSYQVDFGDTIPNPSLSIVKKVLDPITDTPKDSVTVAVDTEVEYKFTVTNDGNVPLTNLVVEDDVLGTISMSKTSLGLGESAEGTASHTVNGDVDNIADATALYDGDEISDQDTASVTVGSLGIKVIKDVSDDESSWSNHVDVYNGYSVYYSFTVENTGDVTLYSVSLSDDSLGAITLLKTTLEPGDKTTNAGTVSTTAVEGTHTNTVTAKGWYLTFDTTDTDTASYTATPEPAKIFGKVFFDEDEEGDIDPGDYGICCTTINLYKDNVFYDSDFTDLDGDYEFTDLMPGNYKVEEIERIPNTRDSTTDPVEETLSEGEAAEINFGDYSDEGEVYGTVFLDRDGDGVKDSEDRGISGVTIKLMDGETEVDSTTTDKDGEYEFFVLSGSYTVKEIDPGWVDDSTTSNEVPVTVVNLGHHKADFGDTVEGGIDILVFNDEDRDTYEDYNEDGIPDVEIEVHDDDGYIDSHYTRSSGWVWIDLLPGTYTIEEIDPEGYFSTTTNSHKITVLSDSWWDWEEFGDAQYQEDIRIDKQVKGRDGYWYNYSAPVGIGEYVEYKFIIKNTGPDPVSDLSVTDTVFGTLDFMPSDLVAGEKVTKTYTSTTTSVKGHHSNTVRVYYDGLPIASDLACYQASDPSSIYGMVFYDDNQDGDYDSPSDYPLKNVYIELYKNGVYYRKDKTDTNGEYSFEDLDPAYYKVKEIDTIFDCFDSTPDEVEYRLKSGEDKEINFGDYSNRGILMGVVYLDKDKDGELDTIPDDRPISGVTIKLWQGTELVDSTTTNGDGEYSFDVNAGTYKVEEINPTTPPNLYSVTQDIFEGVVIARCDYTYRDFLDATDDAGVDVLVFNDIDRDKYFDDTGPEYGLSGVTIMVLDQYDNEDYYTTDGGGYVFIPLTEGKYSIHEEDPSDYFSTTPNVVNVELDTDEQEDIEFGDAEDDARATINLEVQDGNDVWHDGSIAHVMANSPIKLKYTLTNTAVHAQHSLTVIDEWYGYITTHSVLQPGESVTKEYTDTYGLPPDDWSRYVYVYSQESDGQTMDSDTVRQFAEAPEIMSYKDVKGVEPWYDYDFAHAVTGEKVYFKYTVVNQGNIKFTNIKVEDNILGTIDMPDTTIYPGDYTEKIVETTASDGQVINRATVTGDTILTTVSHWNEAEYYGYEPDVKITKSVSANPSGPWENFIDIPVGDTVYYQYIIENTGDVYLENIVLEDSYFGTVAIADVSLNPGGITGTISEVAKSAVAGTDSNTATVTAEWHAVEDFGSWYGKTISDDDDASYFGVNDKVTMVKEIKGSSTGWVDDKVVVPTSDDIQYRFTVTNDGNTELTNIAVTDDTLTDPITFPGDQTTLAAKTSMTSDIITVNDVPAGIVTNEATVAANGELGPVEDTDTATYSAGKPKIEVKKEVSSDEIDWKEYVYVEWHMVSPDKVYFRYTVTNTGDVPLTDIQLEDDVLGSIDVPAGTYPPGQIGIFYAEHDAGYDEERNIATVYGTWENDVVEDGDDASYFGVLLDTDIVKEVKIPGGDWTTAPSQAPLYVETGTIVEYRFIARNTGNTQVDITVEDTVFGTVTMSPSTVPNGDNSYSTDTLKHTTTTGTNFNEVTITSTYKGLEYEWRDSATVIAGEPELELVKLVSTGGGDWTDDLTVTAGDTVDYEFTVTNIGDVTVDNIEIYDDDLDEWISLPISILQPGESMVGTFSDTAVEGEFKNGAEVTGEWHGIPVSDTSSARYFGEAPEMVVDKKIKGTGYSWTDNTIYVETGTTVYYKFTVENTGNVELVDVQIEDPDLGVSIGPITLAKGETYTSSEYDDSAVSGTHTNTITVSATSLLKTFTRTDSATYEAGDLTLDLEKLVSSDGIIWDETAEQYVGQPVQYMFTITNKGDVTITNIVLDDPNLGGTIDLPTNTLDPGDSVIGLKEVTAIEGDQPNTATVSGEWQGISTSNTDDASYFGMNPQITVNKKVWGPITEAWYDTTVSIPLDEYPKFQYTITNTGNVDLTNIFVSDDVLGKISMATELTAGTPDTETVTDDDLAVSGLHTNEVTVTAMHDQKQVGPVTDQATYYGGTPGMEIIKLIKGPDGLWYDVPVILDENDDVYYKYTATNIGTTPIQGLVVVDDHLGPITMTQTDLGIGESAEGTAQSTVAVGENTNTATATATSYDVPLEDEDTATYIGATGEAFIAGVVFDDKNLNGILDDGEPGIGGVSIDLTSPSSSDSTTTNTDGEYSFTITETGTHTVTETDPVGWTSTTDNTVDVDVTILFDQEITVNFGDTGECYYDWTYYLAYEDACDNTFEDFGMIFDVREVYVNDYLTEVQMEFTSRIYDSSYDHLIHLKRNINGASTVTIERPNPVPSTGPFLGKDETPAGTYDFDGEVDLILYNTQKYTNPSKQMDEIVRVTITVEDPQANPKTEGTPPRQFQNEAAEPFYDLEPFWANYDPYMESNWVHGWAISGRIYTTMFGSPGIYVPRILAIPETDWIPPYTGTCIVQPYGSFDDYYRYGTPENWWNLVTNNAVEYGGLSWEPSP